jgi:hypothetical protein
LETQPNVMSTSKSSTKEATKKLTKEDNEARKLILRNVANDLFSLMQGTRKQCYGVIGLERRRAKNIYPWITDGMLDHQIKKLRKVQKRGAAIREFEATVQATATIDQLVADLQVDAEGNQTAVGRPTGSTVEASKTLELRKRKAFDDAVNVFCRFKRRGKLHRGGLNQIIERAKLENGLENECWTISADSVRSRQKRQVATCMIATWRRGPTSPLAPIEPLLVDLCIQRARMGQPLSQSEGMLLVNSIIEGTIYQAKLRRYHIDVMKMSSDAGSLGIAGGRYWRNFKERNKDKLDSGVAIAQAACRKEWSSYLNFSQMYDLVYEQMNQAGVLEDLEVPVWMNLAGEIVSSEAEAFGERVSQVVKHPDYVMFVDEVGNNTNMKDDGRIGGERLLKGKGQTAEVTAATSDAHFTVLGFTAATGEPVMCAIIFAAGEMTQELQLGVDIRAPLVEGDDSIRGNYGPGKRYPGAPTCQFRGKTVPPFVCCSPKGGITSELLKAMLERMDSLDLFPCEQGGPLPFLLLDGHGSRFQLPFMRYVQDKEHEWKVCIGVPNGTAYWQVGDSAEQNGSWKMATTREKRKLSQFRISMGMPVNIRPSDIVPIVNTAWQQSFARVQTNKRAISRRGWTPLNRGLLKSPDVLKTKVVMTGETTTTTTPTPPQEMVAPADTSTTTALPTPPQGNVSPETQATTPAPPQEIVPVFPSHATVLSDITNDSSINSVPKSLNLTAGYAGDFVTGMLQYAIKNERNTENLFKRYKEGKTLRESLKSQDNKRFTAGSLFKANRVAIDSEVLEYMEEKELEAVRKQDASISKHTNEFLTNKDRAELVFASKKEPEVMLIAELKAVVKWKKRKGDNAIPSTKPLLLQRYVDTIQRMDLTIAQFLEEQGCG